MLFLQARLTGFGILYPPAGQDVTALHMLSIAAYVGKDSAITQNSLWQAFSSSQ